MKGEAPKEAEWSGWPEVVKNLAAEYKMSPDAVGDLKLIPMCILLGAITPDHQIEKMPRAAYITFTRTEAMEAILKRFHTRDI